MSQRIWELDAARGFCILGMVVVHLIYDLVELYQMVAWQYPIVFTLIMDWGGVAFVLILFGVYGVNQFAGKSE